MNDILVGLMAIATVMTGYPPVALPYTRALPYRAMMVLACSDNAGRDEGETREQCESRRGLAAVFIPATQRVIISDELDLDTAIGQSFVLHEYVHALQYGTRGETIFDTCEHLLDSEAEAYAVQQQFLNARRQFIRVGVALRFIDCTKGP